MPARLFGVLLALGVKSSNRVFSVIASEKLDGIADRIGRPEPYNSARSKPLFIDDLFQHGLGIGDGTHDLTRTM